MAFDLAPFAERRRRFAETIGDALAVIPAARETARNADTGFEFRQDSDFYFLTGFDEPDAVAVINPAHAKERFVQARVGLHHVCFRARERADVDELHRFLVELGAKIVHAPEDGPWAPGYYSVLFEDPDGIRLEMNHVPGKGLLAQT